MGNRGCLHDEHGIIGSKRFRHRNWVTCALDFKGRKRTINAPGQYTELFALDEATMMAAGHRPCAECRRDAYNRYKAAWRIAHAIAPEAPLSADEIDRTLHKGRIAPDGRQVTFEARLAELPDGVILVRSEAPDAPHLLWRGLLHRWSHDGYGEPHTVRSDERVTVLTPLPSVRAMWAGFVPGLKFDGAHPAR